MSTDSNYTNRVDITLSSNKPLQGSLSHHNHLPHSRHSLKAATKDQHSQDRSKSRNRTSSSTTNDTNFDMITEITLPINKNERRSSEFKRPVDQHERTPVDRRNSIPFSSLFSHTFFNVKHHNKANIKEETNSRQMSSSNIDTTSSAVSSNHRPDIMTAKSNLSLTLKASIDGAKSIPSVNNERSISTPNEDSIGSATFIFEDYNHDPRSTDFAFLRSSTPSCIAEKYHDLFYDRFHVNYCGEFEDGDPFLASLICRKKQNGSDEICEAHTIIRTQYRSYYISDQIDKSNEDHIFTVLLSKGTFPPIYSCKSIGDPKTNEKLYSFDKANDERYNYKIGMIYQQQNQTSEFEIFSNDHMSNEMAEFLDLLAKRVTLKGFTQYRGDLDNKEDSHGEYSYHTTHEQHEIMFNVAPMIPTTKINGQCVERKGLISNAFVCVVFQDTGASFSPDFIPGRVTQVYIVVQPVKIKDELYYKVGIWRRNDIACVVNPHGGTYKKDGLFRKYFLTLLLNAVNIAIDSPSLRARVCLARQRIKFEEIKKLSQLFVTSPVPESPHEIEQIYSMETRSNRSDSMPSSSTIGTNDSANTSTAARTSPNPARKRGFSKIFNVFSSRSSVSTSSSHTSNELSPTISQTTPPPPLSTSEGIAALVRAQMQSTKDSRARSTKTSQAPIPSSRLPSSQVPSSINIHPPTPSVMVSNPINSDKPLSALTISEEDQSIGQDESTDSDEEEPSSTSSAASSEDETPGTFNRSSYS